MVLVTTLALPAAGFAGGTSPALEPGPIVSAPADKSGPDSEAIRFRTEMGLDTSPSLLASLALSTPPSRLFGIPLTSDEEALLLQRVKIQSQLAPLKAYELKHANIWGGTWLSYPRGSTVGDATVVNVGLTRDVASVGKEIAALVPQGAILELHQVRWTEAELDALHESILADSKFYESIGTTFYSVGTYLEDNQLAIEVSYADATVEEAIKEHFPAGMVRVDVGSPVAGDTCGRTNCGPPWRAGLAIFGSGPYDECTSGFTGKYYNGIWNYVLWTGGHCQTATWHLGSPSGTTIGTTAANYFRNGTNVDIQTIPISSSTAGAYYLYGSAGCTSCTLSPVAGSEPSGGDTVGELVLANGAVTGSSGGTLLETNRSFSMPDPYRPGVSVPLTHMRRASYTRHPGDSGGPVLRAHYNTYGAYDIAAGQHTHYVTISGTIYPIYTHIAIIESTTGYDVNTVP